VATGQQLIIPRAPTTLLAAKVDNPAPATQMAASRPVVTQKASVALASNSGDRLEPQRFTYRVKRGDTLFSIARLYNISIETLNSWNARTIHGNRINVGDRLTIFAPRSAN
jgi:LysM repeat protein